MNNLRVLITGASGFIGAPLVTRLAEVGCEVLAISRSFPTYMFDGSVEWLVADLSSSVTYKDKIELFSPEVVIHLAWEDIPDFSFEKSIRNLNQSLDLLSFVTRIESCKKILLSGSCWEFDKIKGECLDTDVGAPKDHFTWAKHSIRSWLEMVSKQQGITFGWFRIFYVYGPKQREASLIPMILTHLKNGNLPQLKTPNNANDFIYIDDVIRAFELATIGTMHSGLYNLGSGESTSVLEVCRLAEQVVRGSDKLSRQLGRASKSKVAGIDFWAGISFTKERLGWKPETSLAHGIEQTWHYMSTQ